MFSNIFGGDDKNQQGGPQQKKSIFSGDTNYPPQNTQSVYNYQPQQQSVPQEKKSIFSGTNLAQSSPNIKSNDVGMARTPQKMQGSQYRPSPQKMVTAQDGGARDSYQPQGFSNPLYNQNQSTGPIGLGNQPAHSVRGSNPNASMYQQGNLNMSRASHQPIGGFNNQQFNAMAQGFNQQYGPTSVRGTNLQQEVPKSQPVQEYNRTTMGEVRPSTVLKVDPQVKEQIRMGSPQSLPYFNEKRCVVTGASSGVGRAVAMWLLNSGAHVALVGRDLDGLIHIGKQFPKQALVIRCDLSKDDQPYDMANTILKEFGGVDIIINAAGCFIEGDIKRMHPRDFDYLMDVNLRSVFYLAFLFNTTLIKNKGCIVNVSGQYGTKPFAGMYGYCMSKAGVESITKSLAFEMAPYGVRVNCVSPGLTETNMLIYRKLEKDQISEAQENAAYFNPMKRIASVDDIGKAIIFLCSEASSHITGQIIKVDGGRTLTTSGWHEFIGSKFVSPPLESKESMIDIVKGYVTTPKGPFFYSTFRDKVDANLKKTNWSTTDKNAHAAIQDAKYKDGEGRYDPIESVITVERAFNMYQSSVKPGQQM